MEIKEQYDTDSLVFIGRLTDFAYWNILLVSW